MDNTFTTFVAGFFIGMVTTAVIALMTLGKKDATIYSDKKITPEWILETDGKKLDTLYIYKNK